MIPAKPPRPCLRLPLAKNAVEKNELIAQVVALSIFFLPATDSISAPYWWSFRNRFLVSAQIAFKANNFGKSEKD